MVYRSKKDDVDTGDRNSRMRTNQDSTCTAKKGGRYHVPSIYLDSLHRRIARGKRKKEERGKEQRRAMMVKERKDCELNESEARNRRKYVVRMRNVAMMVLRSWRVGCGGGGG